ncbi:hypothetical protein FZ103_19290 [Streptomonospora sp. PA3]|nr:hypothetical protein [Streptomonospora sp. PA3]
MRPSITDHPHSPRRRGARPVRRGPRRRPRGSGRRRSGPRCGRGCWISRPAAPHPDGEECR